jgi:hypothetical protein
MMRRLAGFLLVLLALPPLVASAYGTALKVVPSALGLPVPQNAAWAWLCVHMAFCKPANNADYLADIPAAIATVCIGVGIALIVGPHKNQRQPWEKL